MADATQQVVTMNAPTAHAETAVAAVLAFVALCSVAPLLAWVYGLGPFSTWALAVGGPAVAVVAVAAVVSVHRPAFPHIRSAMAIGTVAGVLGTLGYDLVRVPFMAFGLRPLAAIDSYGLLLLGARSSSNVTGFVGWAYHFTNGVCFAIAYALVALRRHWLWGLAWAMVLETATIVTPFADTYGLRGQTSLIVLAYAAHVPYGLALGVLAQRPERTLAHIHEVGRHAVPVLLAAMLAGLLVWHRPWPPYATRAEAVIRDGRFHPTWLRVPVGGCAVVYNTDDQAHTIPKADGAPQLAPGSDTPVCFSNDGVHRVKVDGLARSGGFVIADPTMDGGR